MTPLRKCIFCSLPIVILVSAGPLSAQSHQAATTHQQTAATHQQRLVAMSASSNTSRPSTAARWLLAQSQWPPYPQYDPNDPHTIERGPGGYLAWWKLAIIAVVFVIWAKLADWMNKDAIKFHRWHGLHPQIWNFINVITFLVGLFGAVVNIPIFLLGLPVYLLTSFGPFATYVLLRRGKIDMEAIAKLKGGAEEDQEVEAVELPIQIEAAGDNKDRKQFNLIRARQSEAFPMTAQLLYDAAFRRAEQVVLEFTKDAVGRKTQIDGAWMQQDPLDRPTGDAILVCLKYLANLNPADRRGLQQGRFETRVRRLEIINQLTTQGVPTGERAILKLETSQKQPTELTALGMWPDQLEKLKSIIDSSGYVVVSAPPGQGLTTTWRAVLAATDRYVSDWISIIKHDELDSDMENIQANRFDARTGQSPAKLLPSLLLKQPAGIVVPDPLDAESLDLLTKEVNNHDRRVISRLRAKTATEAVLRLMLLSKDSRPNYVQALRAGLCQRLVRRLCDSCKQPLPHNPQLISQLGGDPVNQPPTLYTHYQPPPPEQRVDEKGQPIDIPVCQTCGGIGYIGRIAVYELLLINDAIRQAILEQPKIEFVNQVAREQGHLNLPQQGYRLVLEGITSVQEIQRVMKN